MGGGYPKNETFRFERGLVSQRRKEHALNKETEIVGDGQWDNLTCTKLRQTVRHLWSEGGGGAVYAGPNVR